MRTIDTPIQMRFADADLLGHVNNANLQHYFDVGKTDYFARVLPERIDWHGRRSLIQRAASLEYLAQTRYGEPVVVRTAVEKVGTTSLTMMQQLLNAETGERKAIARTVMVMFDFEAQEKIPVPESWRQAIRLP